ncbi:MAG: hypothetical protein GYA23_04025 [Methanomicrobiales archaeon]|nr:hypothetical protein [Methanomicrobiales archaeon]
MQKKAHPVTAVPGQRLLSGFFVAVIAGAFILALIILLLPGGTFLALSNYLQIITAMIGALALLYLWNNNRTNETYLFAAAGFGLWGISNIGWYAIVLSGQRALVFPSIIDLGMIASFLVIAMAFRKGFPVVKKTSPLIHLILAACLIIPAAVIALAGLNAATIITLAYFFVCGAFLIIGLVHSLSDHPEILAGAFLFALAFMIYPLREMFLVNQPVLSVIGTFVSAGFALMVLGWLPE